MLRIRAMLTVMLLAAGMASAQVEGIRVNGNGIAYGVPDTAEFTVGVNSLADDVGAATEDANRVASAIIEALKAEGVADTDIRTSSFSVQRVDNRNEAGELTGSSYRVLNSLHVTVRDISLAGDLLATALANGANDAGGLRFTISDPASLRNEARAVAMDDAFQRASQLAELAGVQLGVPVLIEEYSSGGAPVMARNYSMVAAEAASVPVEAGELSVNVDVTVVYTIVPVD